MYRREGAGSGPVPLACAWRTCLLPACLSDGPDRLLQKSSSSSRCRETVRVGLAAAAAAGFNGKVRTNEGGLSALG